LMVIPTVAVARVIARAAGVDPESFPGIAWTSYVAAVTSAGVFTALAALVVFVLTRQWGFSAGAALFAATAYGLAGPAWSFPTLCMSHGVSAGSLMVAYAATFTLRDTTGRRRVILAALAGLGCGLAVLNEFQAAIPVFVLTALLLMEAFRVKD